MTNELMIKVAQIAERGITCIKTAENPYFNSKYADLGTVVEALKAPLKEVGLKYCFGIDKEQVKQEDKEVVVWYLNTYVTDGKDLARAAQFPLVNTNPQQFGASITYAKRYSLCTLFNVIAEEDDDGNTASGNKGALPKKTPTKLPSATKQIDETVPNFF